MEFFKPKDTEYALNVLTHAHILYASMEIGLDSRVHTYSGGLGVLAGDTLRSCADLRLPVAALTLLYRKGYFQQHLHNGIQTESDEPWDIDAFTTALPHARVSMVIEGRTVWVEPRIGIIVGHKQRHIVPVLMLDTHLKENAPQDREITDRLYGGDERMRLKQEAILGIAGKRVLRKIGCRHIHTFHMNEGHAAFAPMEDVLYFSRYYAFNQPRIKSLVKSAHVFTTHTPVPAGHDRFPYEMIKQTIGHEDLAWESLDLGGHYECNMTKLALNLSRYANGVAKKHGEISKHMFPGYNIDSITNGVHLPTWVHPDIQTILDVKMPSWREQPSILERCYQVVTHEELWDAHQNAKRALLDEINARTGIQLDQTLLTIGFARRFATYKRADLIFSHLDRLREIGAAKIQLVFAGQAHPRDEEGKRLIQRVIEYARQLSGDITVVFVEGYDVTLGRLMVQGCDLWLNNPVPPQEASGTSGMKAAANGIPNLSTLDGWWIEGITQNPQAGWIIEHGDDDANKLYDTLSHIIRVYYEHPDRWREHMVHALSLASYFNTHRMVQEYQDRAWTLKLY